MGRPRGVDGGILDGPPIHHEAPGRRGKFKPDHCDSCAVPARHEPLLTFELRLAGKRAGHWTLCRACWTWRNDRGPLDPDPRYVDEDAA